MNEPIDEFSLLSESSLETETLDEDEEEVSEAICDNKVAQLESLEDLLLIE